MWYLPHTLLYFKMNKKMKKIILNAFVLIAIVFLNSCTSNDDAIIEQSSGEGKVSLYFDNGFSGDALLLGNSYTNGNGENLTINRFNYIISNIVLYKTDGSSYVYPKVESYFIINEEKNLKTIELKNIPVGDYKSIKFGLGVDQQRYLEGESNQQTFWDFAASMDMVWTWSTGYRFINFEGSYTSSQTNGEIPFQVHQGSNSVTDNYQEITLNLPTTLRVRTGDLPNIHLVSNANVILNGLHKIKLYDNLNQAGTATEIMGGENLIKIAENSQEMFVVDHVHNGSGTQH